MISSFVREAKTMKKERFGNLEKSFSKMVDKSLLKRYNSSDDVKGENSPKIFERRLAPCFNRSERGLERTKE